MNNKFVRTIIALAIVVSSAPVLAMDERLDDSGMAIEYHGLLNSINGRNDAMFKDAIKNTSQKSMNEYFGNHITKQDLYNLNHNANLSKHDWTNNPWNDYTPQNSTNNYRGNVNTSSQRVTNNFGGYNVRPNSTLQEDCQRIHYQNTGRNFDQDLQENCVIN